MTQLPTYNNESIVRQLFGWGQQSYVKMFCENDFVFDPPNPVHHAWHWHGNLTKTGTTVSLFHAVATDEGVNHKTPEQRAQIPCYHAKACHGLHEVNLGNATARVLCKEDWLKMEKQWFLPHDVPHTLEGWLNISDEMVLKLKGLMF